MVIFMCNDDQKIPNRIAQMNQIIFTIFELRRDF